MRIYTHQGIDFVHISAFAAATNHSISAARTLLSRDVLLDGEGGTQKRRPIKYFRDGSTVWIPVAEIYGYPFIKSSNVYHYDSEGRKYLCETCTFTNEMCKPAQEAAELEVPQGDP